ncbi:MAG TPA: nuclear transport factor 2 family protein [Bryobacteraceae bacterium]|jgi:ketosteroid isomerase-like protein|nr:nuclear transport factor 2 family protein [Bryobacteraceae bacterium]
MSANENIQIAQKAYADFGRGDIPALLAAVDENVEWVTPDIGMAPGGTYRGKAGVAQFFQQVGETWEFQAFEPKEYIASGDRLVVLGSYAFTSRSTGRSGSCDWAMVWKLRDGKVVHFQEYSDTAVLRGALTKASAA